jgi:hypothetical protein
LLANRSHKQEVSICSTTHLLEITHPVRHEHSIHSVVAGLPSVHLVADVQGLAGGFQVQESVDVAEVVAQRVLSAGLADIVRVKLGPRHI